MSIVQVRFEIR